MALVERTKQAIKRFFRHKRIVIISDQEIVSVPVGPRIQAILFSVIVVSMVWVSYASGRYFTYQDILSAKDREILYTNLTNESLQYRVTDLHNNLKHLNDYLKEVSSYDQFGDKAVKKKNEKAGADQESKQDADVGTQAKPKPHDEVSEKAAEKAIEDEYALLDDGVKDVLVNIHHQVLQRIEDLEQVLATTGLKLSALMSQDKEFKQAAARSVAFKEMLLHQGGPFEEVGTSEGTKSDGAQELNMSPYSFEQQLNANLDYLRMLEAKVHRFPLSYPMDYSYISSTFGRRMDPMRKSVAMHYGIDFVGPEHQKVLSTAPGVVKVARRQGDYGLFIEVDHGDGVTSRYGHLSKILVSKGMKVKRGQVIGLQGNTGRSTGSHLHYEVRFRNVPINPKKFLQAGEYVF